MRIFVGDVGGMVFIVLFDFYLLNFSTGFVEGLALEHTFIDLVIVGLDKKHVLFKDTNILEVA